MPQLTILHLQQLPFFFLSPAPVMKSTTITFLFPLPGHEAVGSIRDRGSFWMQVKVKL